jgi:hypothetical protein
MHKDCTALLQLYQYLDRYYLQATQAALPDKLVLIAEQLATEFCKLAKQQPHLLHSQLALTPATQSHSSVLAIKQAVLLFALAQGAKWSAVVTEDVIACSFFRLLGVSSLLKSTENPPDEVLQKAGLFSLKMAGNQFQYRQWRRMLHDSSISTAQKPLHQQTPYALAVQFCSMLSVRLISTPTRAAIGLEQALQQILQQPYQPTVLHFANLLASQAQALSYTGRFCSDGIGEVALITQTTPEIKAFILEMALKQLLPQAISISPHGMKLLPPQKLQDLSWLDLFITTSPGAAEAEPNLTLSELHLLNPHQSVRQQVAWLQTKPQLAAQLMQQASRMSRQQLQIRDLSHAVALVGADNLPLLLRMGWLEQQLENCHQPYAQWFFQLQQCLASGFEILASQSSQLDLTPLQAQLLAGSFCLVLAQDDNCRWYPLVQSNKTIPLVLFSHQTSWQQPDYPRQVSQLVASLGFSSLWQDAVLFYRQPLEMQNGYSQQQCANVLIQLGWLLVQSVFYGIEPTENHWQKMQNSGLKALDLPKQTWQFWQNLLIEQQHCYWPLQPSL